MKLKKNYRVDNKRQIWRIIPTDTGKLIIEEREPEKKRVFFQCLELGSGKKIFKDFGLENNFWIGIEAIRDDIIFFHKFAKPDMPKHKGIFALDIKTRKVFWENPDLTFQFFIRDRLFAYLEKFEGRKYYALNPLNGQVQEELGEDYHLINELHDESIQEENNKSYFFPEVYEPDFVSDPKEKSFLDTLRSDFVISGKIEFLTINDLLMVSFHEANSKGSLNNLFKAVDLSTGKYILEEVLNKEISLFFTDSYFVKDDLLFLLFGKTRLEVYNIIF